MTDRALISGWGAIVFAAFALTWENLGLGIGAVVLAVDALYSAGVVEP